MQKSCSVDIHQTCSSTMDLAQKWALSQESENAHFIQAYTQTLGRGKRERVWDSKKGNFFGTLVIPFSFEAKKRGEISFVVAVAVADILNDLDSSLDLRLKWPNDFLIAKKKVGGVLLEYIEGKNSFLSIGVGLNLVSHPEKIESTCLVKHNINISSDQFRELFIEKMFHYYALWINKGFPHIRNLWIVKAININEFINISIGDKKVRGIFKGINDSGGLVLVRQDGTEKTFYTGEVFF